MYIALSQLSTVSALSGQTISTNALPRPLEHCHTQHNALPWLLQYSHMQTTFNIPTTDETRTVAIIKSNERIFSIDMKPFHYLYTSFKFPPANIDSETIHYLQGPVPSPAKTRGERIQGEGSTQQSVPSPLSVLVGSFFYILVSVYNHAVTE